MVPYSSAHLDSGFDKKAGPYTFDVGWTPNAPNAGQSTLMAVNVVNAGSETPANLSTVWVRLDLKDEVHFAGTLALTKGSTSLSYVFPKAGIWTITVQAGGQKTSGNIWIPGEPPSNETWAWILTCLLAISTAILAYYYWKCQKK